MKGPVVHASAHERRALRIASCVGVLIWLLAIWNAAHAAGRLA